MPLLFVWKDIYFKTLSLGWLWRVSRPYCLDVSSFRSSRARISRAVSYLALCVLFHILLNISRCAVFPNEGLNIHLYLLYFMRWISNECNTKNVQDEIQRDAIWAPALSVKRWPSVTTFYYLLMLETSMQSQCGSRPEVSFFVSWMWTPATESLVRRFELTVRSS